jgi:hypothetical protein
VGAEPIPGQHAVTFASLQEQCHRAIAQKHATASPTRKSSAYTRVLKRSSSILRRIHSGKG